MGLPRRSIAAGLVALSSLVCLQGCLLIESFGGTYEVAPVDGGGCGSAEGICDAKWSLHFPGPNTSTVGGLAVSDADRVYVVGSFAGSMKLDGTVSSPGVDAFAVALDTAGAVERSLVTNAGHAKATSVTTVGTDVIFAGTYTDGYAGCGDGAGIFVLVTDSGFSSQDAVCFPATGFPEVTGIAVDEPMGAVWIAGSYDGTLTVGSTTLMTPATSNGFVFAIGLESHEPIGAPVDVAGAGDQRIDGIGARNVAGGGFVVAGTFTEEVSLAEHRVAAIGGSDVFVALFDGSGVPSKLHAWGSDDDDESGGIAVTDGNVFLAGEVDGGVLAFEGGKTVSPATEESVAGFVAAFEDRVDSLSEPLWVASVSAEDLDVTELAVSESFVFAGGLVTGALELDDESTVPGGCDDMFVTRVGRADGGSPVATRCGNAGMQTLMGLGAAVPDDEVFFATEVGGSIRVGDSQSYTSEGDIDIVVGQVLPP